MKSPKETSEKMPKDIPNGMTEEKKVEISVSFKEGGVFKSTIGKQQEGIAIIKDELNDQNMIVSVDLKKISLKGQAIVICDTNGIAHIIYMKEHCGNSKKKYKGNNEEETSLIYKSKEIMYFKSKDKAKPKDIYKILKKRELEDFAKKLFVKSGEQKSYRFNTQRWYDWKE